jgi:hypothetical protein
MNSEQQLLQALQTNVDSFDNYFEEDSADAPVISKKPMGGISMGKTKGNPAFSAQFDIAAYVKFYTLTSGAYTGIAASALSATLKTKLPVFLFGFNDWRSGYPKMIQTFPVSVWSYSIPFIYGKSEVTSLALDSTVKADLIAGDLVIPFTSALPGSGTTSLALVIIRCTQVAFGTLLESLASDRFVLNKIRYVVPDETATSLAQYAQNIGMFKQSLFGKFDSDYLSPNSYKVPEQQQKNLIDIPLKIGIDKQRALSTYINYDVSYFSWSIFVWTVKKLG